MNTYNLLWYVQVRFSLTAVMLHTGTLVHRGHYMAVIKCDGGGWWLCDDKQVRSVLLEPFSYCALHWLITEICQLCITAESIYCKQIITSLHCICCQTDVHDCLSIKCCENNFHDSALCMYSCHCVGVAGFPEAIDCRQWRCIHVHVYSRRSIARITNRSAL